MSGRKLLKIRCFNTHRCRVLASQGEEPLQRLSPDGCRPQGSGLVGPRILWFRILALSSLSGRRNVKPDVCNHWIDSLLVKKAALFGKSTCFGLQFWRLQGLADLLLFGPASSVALIALSCPLPLLPTCSSVCPNLPLTWRPWHGVPGRLTSFTHSKTPGQLKAALCPFAWLGRARCLLSWTFRCVNGSGCCHKGGRRMALNGSSWPTLATFKLAWLWPQGILLLKLRLSVLTQFRFPHALPGTRRQASELSCVYTTAEPSDWVPHFLGNWGKILEIRRPGWCFLPSTVTWPPSGPSGQPSTLVFAWLAWRCEVSQETHNAWDWWADGHGTSMVTRFGGHLVAAFIWSGPYVARMACATHDVVAHPSQEVPCPIPRLVSHQTHLRCGLDLQDLEPYADAPFDGTCQVPFRLVGVACPQH